MTVIAVVALVVLVTVAVTGYQIGFRAGRVRPPPRPARPTYDVHAVRVLASHAYNWETDDA